jgi:ankyrin repeat protein
VLQPSPLSPSFTHYLPSSNGNTALKFAIDNNKAEVAAYLRSIGAPQ